MPFKGQSEFLTGVLYNNNGEKLMDICDIESVDMSFDDKWDENNSIYEDFTKELTFTFKTTVPIFYMKRFQNLMFYGWKTCGPLRKRLLQKENMKRIRRQLNGN